jgi:hypothetical protein
MGLITKEVMYEGLNEMLELILMSLLMITQMWVMMTMSLHPWAKQKGLGWIDQEEM